MSDAVASPLLKSSQEIAADIAAAIAERRLPPGAKLKEEALARLYSVSRTKIRAALLMLSKDELIEIVPERGACVSTLSQREALEIFAVRRILEAALAREFVEKADEEDYQRIEAHLVEERRALCSGDLKKRTKLLGDFHILIAEIVGNQVLLSVLQKLTARISLAAMQSQTDHAAACSSEEHELFIEAAKSGSADRAVELMLQHLDHVSSALTTGYGETDRNRDLVRALLA